MKPLFIPLKAEFYWAFKRGDKVTEFRKYGPRWNERTCPVGRSVVLSLGYGKKNRTPGIIRDFVRKPMATEDWMKCYGHAGIAACIGINLHEHPVEPRGNGE